MHYLNKLEHDNFVNLVIGTNRNPSYNCKITTLSRNNQRSSVVCDLIETGVGGVWYPKCQPTYVYKGIEYTHNALHVGTKEPHRVLMRRIKDYYNWRQQWPEDLTAYIQGKEVGRPKINRRELIPYGDIRYFDTFYIEDFKFDDPRKADDWFRQAQNTNEFMLAITGRGPWPMYCGATRDGVLYGEVGDAVYYEY